MKPLTNRDKADLALVIDDSLTIGKPPAFPFYVNDWLGSGDVSSMLPEQEGAYIRLLAVLWASDRLAIPSDPKRLAMISRLGVRWGEMGPAILECFSDHPFDEGKLTQRRLLRERAAQVKRRLQNQENARRTHGERKATAEPPQSILLSPLSSVPSPVSSLPDSDSASPKSQGDDDNDQAKDVMTWFYDRWEAANPGRKFPTKSVPFMKERSAAKRLLKDSPDYEKLTRLLDEALRGYYYAAPPDCLANFKPTRYTAANRKTNIPTLPSQTSPSDQKAQAEELARERARIARQTDCAAELRYGQRTKEECGKKDECRDCPQLESPGSGRYTPGPTRRTGERFDDPGFESVGDMVKKLIPKGLLPTTEEKT